LERDLATAQARIERLEGALGKCLEHFEGLEWLSHEFLGNHCDQGCDTAPMLKLVSEALSQPPTAAKETSE
jgi:hypothetical protein